MFFSHSNKLNIQNISVSLRSLSSHRATVRVDLDWIWSQSRLEDKPTFSFFLFFLAFLLNCVFMLRVPLWPPSLSPVPSAA